jgi:transcription elongation factor Elf1
MPYTKQEDRTPDISNSIMCLVNEIKNKGDLNYTICELTSELIIKTGGMGYTNVSNWIDGVHGAERELTRRLLNPYEDLKKEENGDVEGFVTLLNSLKG